MNAVGFVILVAVFFLDWSPYSFMMTVGSGMEPTLNRNEHVRVRSVGVEEIGRGNLIAYSPAAWFPGDNSMAEIVLVSRVVGVGDDWVMCCDDAGRIVVNDRPVTEDYLLKDDPHPDRARLGFYALVPPGHMFVANDNRGDSTDSRDAMHLPNHGAIPHTDIKGVAVSEGGGLLKQSPAFIDAGLPDELYEDGWWYFDTGLYVVGFLLFGSSAIWLGLQQKK